MIVAQLVNSTTSRFIPTTSPAILAGQCISRSNTLVTTTSGGPTILGVVQHDVSAFVASPQTNGVTFNQARTANVATNGRLAIRAVTPSALAVGGTFSILNGEAVVTGTGGTVAATTINGDLLIIDERVTGADGIMYLMVFFN